MTDDTAAGSPPDPTQPDEAELTALLRTLPDPVMPEDVAARLDTALRTAPPLPTASGGATVLPLASARERQARRQRWNGRALGVAAGVAAAVVVSGVVVSQLSSNSSNSADLTAAAGAGAEAQTLAVVSSSTDYSSDQLPQQLNAVLTSATTSSSPSSTPAEDGGSGPLALRAAPDGYQPQLQQCVTGLTEGSDSAPLLADYARFQHKPALVVAVPGRMILGTVEVFVVSRDCTGGADLRLYYYRVVKVAELPALAGVTLPSPTASP